MVSVLQMLMRLPVASIKKLLSSSWFAFLGVFPATGKARGRGFSHVRLSALLALLVLGLVLVLHARLGVQPPAWIVVEYNPRAHC